MPPRVSREEWDRRAAAVGIEWVGDEPIYSGQRREAQCLTCGHRWQAWPANARQGQGCKRCADNGRRRSSDEWDRRAAGVGIEWTGNAPVTSNIRHPARCLTCGHKWEVQPSSVSQGHGCPVCAGNAPIDHDEWLRRASEVGIEWVDATPESSMSLTGARCLSCGYEWSAWPIHVGRGVGCARCAQRSQRLDAEAWHERAARAGIEWVAGSPQSSRQKHLARCLTCHYEWDAWPTSVAQGSGCPSCAGVAPVPRKEWDRRAAAVGVAWTSNPPKGMLHRAAVRCLSCGYEYETTGTNVSNGAGCAACAQHGFDPSQPASVYLLRHDQRLLMKVGVTKTDSRHRLNSHKWRGWEQIATWPVPLGRDALAIEKSVLEWWSASGARQCRRQDVPGGDGWTEAVHIGTSADEPRTIAFIEERVAAVGGGSSG